MLRTVYVNGLVFKAYGGETISTIGDRLGSRLSPDPTEMDALANHAYGPVKSPENNKLLIRDISTAKKHKLLRKRERRTSISMAMLPGQGHDHA